MPRIVLAILCVLSFAAVSPAADQPAPAATAGGCPAGAAAAATAGSANPAALPPGHPPMGGGAGVSGGGMPKGHPDISGMTKKPAATQPTSARVIIREAQGTPGGPVAGGDRVSIDWYLPDQLPKRIDSKLDDKGTVIIDNLPLVTAAQPVVTVTHAGVEHQAIGEVMTPGRPDQVIDVKVYETTEVKPQWKLHMWHMMLERAKEGLAVSEMIVIENPADRSWIGSAAAGKRTTVTLSLPTDIQDLKCVRGLQDSGVKVENGRLVSAMALQPGINQYEIQYLIPAKNGQAKLDLTTPAVVDNMVIMLPDDGSTVTAAGLGEPTAMKNGNQPGVRFYKKKDLAAGYQAALTIGGFAAGENAAGAAAPTTASSWGMPKIVAAAGGGLLLTTGLAAVMFVKPAHRKGGCAKCGNSCGK